MELTLNVNGREWRGDVPGRLVLADLLRDRLHLTGTHLGCEQGVCGACTVLVDGDAVRSCLMLALQADGCSVQTVESLAPDGQLSRIQAAFLRHRALQCGFCTPGFLMSITALLDSGQRYNREELAEMLSGNVCRCTGYEPILDAVLECQD
jgi:aerobic-type carbon monoxide dehydrogenase small subunit (CoxS/CutS family)